MCLFFYIPCDLVEIVIVYTDYTTLQCVKQFYAKLNNEHVDSRIKDKISYKHIDRSSDRIFYILQKNPFTLHRGQDKPAFISEYCYEWFNMDILKHRFNDLPTRILIDGSRYWSRLRNGLPTSIIDELMVVHNYDEGVIQIYKNGDRRYFSNCAIRNILSQH